MQLTIDRRGESDWIAGLFILLVGPGGYLELVVRLGAQRSHGRAQRFIVVGTVTAFINRTVPLSKSTISYQFNSNYNVIISFKKMFFNQLKINEKLMKISI